MLAAVYLWSNGMVMAFDEGGRQLGEYQGMLGEVHGKIMRDRGPETEFCGGWPWELPEDPEGWAARWGLVWA